MFLEGFRGLFLKGVRVLGECFFKAFFAEGFEGTESFEGFFSGF